jgi:hypothetical protein
MGRRIAMKFFAAILLLVALNAAPAAAKDPLSSLRFLVGTWKCSYHAGKAHAYYKATYSYDLGGNWLRESDSWAGGGSDLGMITYEPKTLGWTAVVLEEDRTTTLFRAPASSPNRIVYRSIYPSTAMTDVFERESPTRYTLHFTQNAGGKTIESTDVCVKN